MYLLEDINERADREKILNWRNEISGEVDTYAQLLLDKGTKFLEESKDIQKCVVIAGYMKEMCQVMARRDFEIMKTIGRRGGLQRERLNNRTQRSWISPGLTSLSLCLLDHLQKESSSVGLEENSTCLKDMEETGNLSAGIPFFLSKYSVF